MKQSAHALWSYQFTRSLSSPSPHASWSASHCSLSTLLPSVHHPIGASVSPKPPGLFLPAVHDPPKTGLMRKGNPLFFPAWAPHWAKCPLGAEPSKGCCHLSKNRDLHRIAIPHGRFVRADAGRSDVGRKHLVNPRPTVLDNAGDKFMHQMGVRAMMAATKALFQ